MFRCEFLEIRMREKLPKSASAHITRPHSARARAAPAGGEKRVRERETRVEIYISRAQNHTRTDHATHTHSLTHTFRLSHTTSELTECE